MQMKTHNAEQMFMRSCESKFKTLGKICPDRPMHVFFQRSFFALLEVLELKHIVGEESLT